MRNDYFKYVGRARLTNEVVDIWSDEVIVNGVMKGPIKYNSCDIPFWRH